MLSGLGAMPFALRPLGYTRFTEVFRFGCAVHCGWADGMIAVVLETRGDDLWRVVQRTTA
jgi:hypothetical protein